ncbi:hypothetical protein J6590_022600 [Homalodisca vitripennis]|nr:hypothetical protein J6590_022600 [Homalodisca vitripennis]
MYVHGELLTLEAPKTFAQNCGKFRDDKAPYVNASYEKITQVLYAVNSGRAFTVYGGSASTSIH